jgi:probable phosphoglycerate mutase
MTTFFLVRHGLTPDTGQRLTGWTPGVHLTEEGRLQAKAVAEALAASKIKALYSSPIDRTMDTAQAIAERLDLEIQVDEEVGEIRFGRWTNRSLKSLARTKLWAAVQRFPSGALFPEGESLREAQARAVAEIERLRRLHPRDGVCIVSHADVIKLITAHYLGVHIDLFQRIYIAPASITVVSVGDAGPFVLAVNHVPARVGESA